MIVGGQKKPDKPRVHRDFHKVITCRTFFTF